MRKIIADRMKESLLRNAQLTHQLRIDMTNAVELRTRLKGEGLYVTYNDIFLSATARALAEFPIMNSEITEEGILVKNFVNLGIAVSLDGGLIVPNIKNAHKLSLKEISIASSDLVNRAKKFQLKAIEYREGTFTVSNLGGIGLDSFTAIINPPESGILAIGKIQDTPVARNNAVEIRPIVSVVLSYDHRVLDGEPASRFLIRIKELMEEPDSLI